MMCICCFGGELFANQSCPELLRLKGCHVWLSFQMCNKKMFFCCMFWLCVGGRQTAWHNFVLKGHPHKNRHKNNNIMCTKNTIKKVSILAPNTAIILYQLISVSVNGSFHGTQGCTIGYKLWNFFLFLFGYGMCGILLFSDHTVVIPSGSSISLLSGRISPTSSSAPMIWPSTE